MVESIHKFKYMYHMILVDDPPKVTAYIVLYIQQSIHPD